MITWSASGEAESLNADIIHCLFGMTTSSARIAAPITQLKTIKIRKTPYATGVAPDDKAGFDITPPPIYRLSINYLSIIVKYYIESR